MRPGALLAVALILAPGLAAAQTAPSPASTTPAAAPPIATAPATTAPPAAAPATSPPPKPAPPVITPPPPSDNTIDSRIRASADAAQSYQGSLDGPWTLIATRDARPLYAFQLVDRPGGQSPVEGAWRDLRLPPVPGDIGLIDVIERTPQSLSIAFAPKPGAPRVTIELKPGPTGWTGELLEAGVLTRVRLRHW